MKITTNLAELRWSKWGESMRKDVECAFAILKGRWLILKGAVRSADVTDADKIFKTCVALHNWLLTYDGLDKEWKSGKKSDWEELGEYNPPTASAARIFPGCQVVLTLKIVTYISEDWEMMVPITI
eukprot:CAMPEP_0172415212 /NCGR_PEP_ID=MMETSP1064-20121228/1684_1 /TAXON_ID=202472 /ORGANISM="Aulacoseira subarctica , Strain CCAP 1002/5" /LENGTH=125 /DNA_ID=CAMNT_0013152125 /DNA_START=991 /DNA_END=1368 /DNA_ORIENTATION=+